MKDINSSFLLLILAPIFLTCFVFELVYSIKKKLNLYNFKDTVTNISLALMYQVSDIIFTIVLVKTIYTWVYIRGFHLFTGFTWNNILLLFILQDFLYYWFHRAAHRVRWVWASHVTHHSSTLLNFSTSFRQSMTYPISLMWAFWIPLAYIGFSPDSVLIVVALNLAFQFFIHTQIIGNLGILELIFNTPSHHRAHHGTNPKYIDHNYGGIFIIWDRLFGTFVDEKELPNYGIVGQIHSFNPIVLVFHEWKALFHDIIKNKDLRHIWKAPSWNNKDYFKEKY